HQQRIALVRPPIHARAHLGRRPVAERRRQARGRVDAPQAKLVGGPAPHAADPRCADVRRQHRRHLGRRQQATPDVLLGRHALRPPLRRRTLPRPDPRLDAR
ncbi:MAG: hypothetical protein ACK559_39700, partial [bacterium]